MLDFENIASVTDILRNGKSYFDGLASGEMSKVIVVKNSQPAAVLLSIDEYERITSGKDLIGQYQLMRMNIMLMAEKPLFDYAYIYAWYNNVYPWLHDSADWHKPFESCFNISEQVQERIYDVLCDRWDESDPMTFYELEKHFGARSNRDGIDRVALIKSCRYLFLESFPEGLDGIAVRFDENLWRTLVTNGKCPSEAHSIIRPPEKDNIHFT